MNSTCLFISLTSISDHVRYSRSDAMLKECAKASGRSWQFIAKSKDLLKKKEKEKQCIIESVLEYEVATAAATICSIYR